MSSETAASELQSNPNLKIREHNPAKERLSEPPQVDQIHLILFACIDYYTFQIPPLNLIYVSKFDKGNSTTGVSRPIIQAASSPLLNIDNVHIPAVIQSQGHAYLLEELIAAIDQYLHKRNATSMYLDSIFRMIFLQSLGLLVTSPNTLLFRLLFVSE